MTHFSFVRVYSLEVDADDEIRCGHGISTQMDEEVHSNVKWEQSGPSFCMRSSGENDPPFSRIYCPSLAVNPGIPSVGWNLNGYGGRDPLDMWKGTIALLLNLMSCGEYNAFFSSFHLCKWDQLK